MRSNLETMLRRVRDEEIGFGDFVAGTRTEFRRMALHLMRRWKTPEWLVVEDVEQELYLGAWRFVPRFDPAKGKSLARYVVFNAMSEAKREMHRARGVTIHGNPDRRVSRFEVPVSHLGAEEGDGEALTEVLLAESPEAEDAMIATQRVRRSATEALWACATPRERTAVLAIREAGSLDKAGLVLYDDVDLRIANRLGSEEQAERFIQKHAGAVAQRIAQCVV